MIINLKNKVVVITGASRGIGKELVMAFSNEGAKVVINYNKSEQSAIQIVNSLKNRNHDCIKIKADITNNEEVLNLYKRTIYKYGKVDVLINNAGICNDAPCQTISYQQWKSVVDVNLTGMHLCCQVFLKSMINQNYGKIINIASIKGQEGSENQVNYSASKAGVIGYTKSLAKELGRYNISVNAVCPGFILTDMNKSNIKKFEIAKRRSILSLENNLTDLVNFMIYMASDKFRGVTGQIYNIDSRMSL